jgi:hypothetical protein
MVLGIHVVAQCTAHAQLIKLVGGFVNQALQKSTKVRGPGYEATYMRSLRSMCD